MSESVRVCVYISYSRFVECPFNRIWYIIDHTDRQVYYMCNWGVPIRFECVMGTCPCAGIFSGCNLAEADHVVCFHMGQCHPPLGEYCGTSARPAISGFTFVFWPRIYHCCTLILFHDFTSYRNFNYRLAHCYGNRY